MLLDTHWLGKKVKLNATQEWWVFQQRLQHDSQCRLKLQVLHSSLKSGDLN